MRAGAPVRHVLVAASLLADDRPRVVGLLTDLERGGCRVVAGSDKLLERLTEGRDGGPIVGLVDLPDEPPFVSIAGSAASLRLLVAVEIEDPGNLGALVRTALVGGADALVLVGGCDPFHPRSVRISRGSLFRVPVARLSDAETLLSILGQHRIRSLAAVARGGEPLPELQISAGERWAICVGGESRGLPAGIAERMDRRVSIPMADGVDSYSVHAAAAILLYALARR